MNSITLDISPFIELTDEQFYQLCQHHSDYRFERTASGALIVMSPTGGETGKRNVDLLFQLQAWNRQHKLGIVFDSSTGFKLPNGANRSPDASWIKIECWDALTLEQRQKFPPLCPDFVVELCSPSDSLSETQKKMREYMDNRARLGWLINSQSQRVEIYRQAQNVEVLDAPQALSGEAVLPGFVLDLAEIVSK